MVEKTYDSNLSGEPADTELVVLQALLLDSVAEGVIVRVGEKIMFVNAAARSMFGFDSVDEAIAQPSIDSLIHPEDMPVVAESFRRRLAGEDAPLKYSFRILRKNRPICWVSCRAQIVSWGGEQAVAACLTDISEAKAAERVHSRSELLFSNVFRMNPEVMLLANLRDGTVRDVNPAFLNIFGQRRDDIINHKVAELDIWADKTFLRRFVEELKITASMTDVPTTVKTRGNLVRHFRLFAQKIDHGGEQLLLLIGRDVTDDMVQTQDLQRGKDIAELANRAKSDFLANMSHELRTPLNAILGFSEIIRDEIIGPVGVPRYSEYAHDIHESGTHLLSIINDILDLSKVEAGRLDAHLSWIDPTDCLELCLTLVQQRAFESNILLKHYLDSDVLLEADDRLLKQIGLNLLTNAVKFTGSGGTVTLALSRTANKGLCLSVEDTGVGMTADEIRVARRPFGQVNIGSSRQQEGSGLGLPLVSGFVEKLSATLLIDSQPGVGTCVKIIFPPFKVKDRVEDNSTDI